MICGLVHLRQRFARGSHGGPHTWGRCLQAQHSRPWLARLATMPEVLPVQFMQMLCSNGVKLRLDLAVAEECNGKHKQCCANDPQPEEAPSPVHCLNLPMPLYWLCYRHNNHAR